VSEWHGVFVVGLPVAFADKISATLVNVINGSAVAVTFGLADRLWQIIRSQKVVGQFSRLARFGR